MDYVNTYKLINGSYDLAMDGEMRPYIGKVVFIEQKTKGGMYVFRDGKNILTVAKRNLSPTVTATSAQRRTPTEKYTIESTDE